MKNVVKKNGIIFGSTGVLGKQISIEVAKSNVNLILHGKSSKKLADLHDQLKKLNKNITLLQADVTTKEFSANILNIIYSRFKKIDFIINVIGLFYGLRPLTNFSHKEWDNLLEINLSSCWRIIKELEPIIKNSNNSKIIFLSNKNISVGKAYHNTFSIFENARRAMLKTLNEENLKLNIETHLIEIEKINLGMSLSLAGKEEFNKNSLTEITDKVLKKIF